MNNLRLKIDTSASSGRNDKSTPSSAHSTSTNDTRPRVLSPSSSTSSFSFASSAFSSANPSSSSVNVIPDVRSSSSASTQTAQPHDAEPHGPDESDDDLVLAMHDFIPQHKNATCLSFQAGHIIRVLNRDSSGWWDGELDGKRGWFPSNYVTTTPNLLTEEFPNLSTFKRGHGHSISAVSVTSWASTSSPRHGSFSRTNHQPSALDHEIDSYCPIPMLPLLHGLSLLRNAVRSNRVAHFQPATACIISCVRSILTTTGCLSRASELLRQFNVLFQERKIILSDLAALVSQAKKSSEDFDDDEQREIEVEAMLRLGGQVFAHVRRFLVVAIQCGVEVPEKTISVGSTMYSSGKTNADDTLIEGEGDTEDDEDTFKRRSPIALRTTNGIVNRPYLASRHSEPSTPRLALRAKSLNDLQNQRSHHSRQSSPRLQSPRLKKHDTSPMSPSLPQGTIAHHSAGLSTSSASSSSSFSSFDSVKTPGSPRFPNGPCSVSEVMEALRHTHDQYLSTIAAFIGHAHSHSRTSHASSTDQIFELVREVVETVCKLLTIVDAVMKHQDIPSHKVANLKSAKVGLYSVIHSLAESVKILISGDDREEKTEEQEREELLKSATNALKVGADCVNEVKKCLTWSVGDKPIMIRLPRPGEAAAEAFTPRRLGGLGRAGAAAIQKTKSLNGLRPRNENDTEAEEDLTVQGHTVPPPPLPPPLSQNDPRDKKLLPPLIISSAPVPDDLPSPVSVTRTEDDTTTWEGSHRTGRPSEDKMSPDVLPSISSPSLASRDMLSHNYPAEDVAYNKDGILVGASLDCLVEKMTPHDNIVDPAFSAVFFLTFRMFTSAQGLVEAIIARYNLEPPLGLTEEDLCVWQQRKGFPVRLRVANFLKLWLETYWKSATDDVALGTLMAFTRDALAKLFPHPSSRLMELIVLRSQQTDAIVSPKSDRAKDPGMLLNPPSALVSGLATDVPRPIMTKALLTSLRNRGFGTILVLEFDALELARQMTIMESKLYCAITAEEILETGKEGPRGTAPIVNVNVKAVTTLSTVITGWVAESILNEADTKKRTALVKFFIKLSDRCNSLNNFSTPRAILAALDSSTISRLNQTWLGLPQKYKGQLNELRKLADHARNYSEYRGRLRNTSPPAVPFLGLYLTDVTFCREGNPSQRASPVVPEKKLINFNKYHKLARIVQDMQRFQVGYNFKEIPEAQEYLQFVFEKSKRQGDIQDLYRRSLLIEPKQPADLHPTNDLRQLFGWATRSSNSTTPVSAS